MVIFNFQLFSVDPVLSKSLVCGMNSSVESETKVDEEDILRQATQGQLNDFYIHWFVFCEFNLQNTGTIT